MELLGPSEVHVRPDTFARAAGELHARAVAADPEVTPRLATAVSRMGGTLVNLDRRLKDPASLERKLATDAAANAASLEEAVAHNHDALRYTAVLRGESFGSDLILILGELRLQGFRVDPSQVWNYFVEGNRYKAVHAYIGAPESGLTFEIQFHTPESLAAKLSTDALYHRIRDLSTPPEERAALIAAERRVSEAVPEPAGVGAIGRPYRQPDVPGEVGRFKPG